jgi:AmmeMemoRadiSam system protein A
VTLEIGGELRGCIGTLKARRPLVVEVAHMARAAAMEDPRFPPLARAELGAVQISISVLSVPAPLEFASEADLLAKLRPGVDGLILREGYRSGTFLPSVWDKLPAPADFLRQLKRKAGLAPDHWSDSLTIEGYTTESFGDAH